MVETDGTDAVTEGSLIGVTAGNVNDTGPEVSSVNSLE